jgi:hypothetical protein
MARLMLGQVMIGHARLTSSSCVPCSITEGWVASHLPRAPYTRAAQNSLQQHFPNANVSITNAGARAWRGRCGCACAPVRGCGTLIAHVTGRVRSAQRVAAD